MLPADLKGAAPACDPKFACRLVSKVDLKTKQVESCNHASVCCRIVDAMVIMHSGNDNDVRNNVPFETRHI